MDGRWVLTDDEWDSADGRGIDDRGDQQDGTANGSSGDSGRN